MAEVRFAPPATTALPTPEHLPPAVPPPAPRPDPTATPVQSALNWPELPVLDAEALLPHAPLPTTTPPARTMLFEEPTLSFDPAAAATLPPLDERVALFNDIWQTVYDTYLYLDFRGLDWVALRNEYAARVVNAATREEFYTALVEMVDLLDDQHSRFVPPSDVPAEDAATSGRETRVGIGVLIRPHDGVGMIQFVFPGSPAERAGLRQRDRVVAVDGRPFAPEADLLAGEPNSPVHLTVERPGGERQEVVLVREEVQEHLAPVYRRLTPDIGYVYIPTLWVDDMGEQVNGALTDLAASGELHGMVLDLRGNRGGWGDVLAQVLSHFVRGQAGGFFGRESVRPLMIEPPAGPDLRGLPLVVLIDGETASYAEVLAAVLRQQNGARIVGRTSAGNTETIYAHVLRDGSRLWLARESFRLPDGSNLEGVGVLPDVVIDDDWTRYTEANDPYVQTALRLLGAEP